MLSKWSANAEQMGLYKIRKEKTIKEKTIKEKIK